MLCLGYHITSLVISRSQVPRGLLYLFRCLICIPCYTSLNLRGFTPLFGVLLLTTLEGLCHFCICSSVLFNGDLGPSLSSKSITSFPLSSMFCSVSFSSSSVSSCSSSGISTSSGSNLALNWSAWANIGCPVFVFRRGSRALFCPFCRMNLALSWSASLFPFISNFLLCSKWHGYWGSNLSAH